MTPQQLEKLTHDIKLWGRELGFDQIGITGIDLADEEPRLQAWLDQRERGLLMQTLHETSFDPVATAARLGVSQRQMRYRIERLNIAIPNPGDSHGAGQ
mgnify:CR=1 FL=1